ncbi:zinc finger CCCH domain-containing protein 11A isoform X2 [Salminus brasiliensis]|uniref:zinc finger CCCH domain-containing protein 11A isoform X2 n=1 Tax=Salminus brasiliensis TaxID=930266 RepID=UPI003B83858A
MSMNNKGDDCYFFYYSTCTKGDSCPFRHCEAAMGSEIMCSLWQENRCFRNVCKFRHMEIKKNRKEIPCYWENQPGGCQKQHCAFHHEKSHLIDGMYVPPDKGQSARKENEEEAPQEDHAPSAPAPISNPTNPQLRGVIKSETQESVPSPTHPPVVINPVDDEDDEDDQISEEGDEASGLSPKKLTSPRKDDSLNFGIKTLEEIRLRKALKANLKRAGYPSSNGTGTEKENIQSLRIPAAVTSKSEFPDFEDPGKRKVTDRLGKRIQKEDVPVEHDLQLKGSLAKRLGGFVDSPQNTDIPPQKAMRPVHERLGTSSDLTAPKSPNSESKPSAEIRIKTLEEIRQEKAAKSQLQRKGVRVISEVPTKTLISTQKGNRPVSGPQVKTFSEILHEKKKLQEEKAVSQEGGSSSEKSEDLASAGAVKVGAQAEEVRVKTLEEIRREKAAKMQAQAQETTSDNTPSSSDVALKRRILRVSKNTATPTASQKKLQDSEKKTDCAAESVAASGKPDSSSQSVTVKSFEEIMREKRLRKQQETQANQPDQLDKKTTPRLSEEKPPAAIRPRITGPAASPPSLEPSNQAKPPVQQRLGLKSQAPAGVPKVLPQKTSAELQTKSSLAPSPKKLKLSPSEDPPVQVSEVAASPDIHIQEPPTEQTPEAPKTSPSKAVETKVRPKLNVKPSVMKPATQVKLGQKRKTAGSHCSAVAAVKPLNAVPAPEMEPPCKREELSAPVCSPEVGLSTQEISDVSIPSKATSSVTGPPSVQQSPVVRTPSQSRARRSSVVSARTAAPAGNSSTVDDFEDLLDEFTDDKLEDEMQLDPGVGEDDLLLELSEMIDS